MTSVLAQAPEWAGVFASALRGHSARLHGFGGAPLALPVKTWREQADAADRVVLAHCTDLTLDIGCGPGRMTYELVASGRHALGIDVVPEAVRQTRERGVAALTRDVFGPLPGEGRWTCALLADGNIGIGGDPVKLLSRVHALLAVGGRAVVDLAEPGIGLRTRAVRIECRGIHSEPFDWSILGPESVRDVARAAGFAAHQLHEYDGRWFAVLHKSRSVAAG